jgi:uncharacterized repeat protein (TIGR01451 family)
MLSTKPQRMPPVLAGNLPRWWRHVLVAMATLILCSCRELPKSTSQLDLGAAPALPSHRVAGVERSEPPAAPGATVRDVQQTAFNTGVDQMDRAALLGGRCAPPPPPVDPCPVESACVSAPCGPCAVVGPSDEYLCDGGDFGSPAAVRPNWTVEGVEQEDAIAHYDTVDGQVVVEPSNRVCVYAPRFAAVRRVCTLMASERRQPVDVVMDEAGLAQAGELTPVATSIQRQAAAVDLGERPASLFRERQQAGGLENLEATIDVYSTLAASADLQVIRTGQVEGSETAKLERAVESAVTWTGDQAAQVVFENKQAVAVVGLRQPGLVYQTSEPNSPRLRLLKLASTGHALPGEEITFTLRFDNIGDRVIGNVTVIDNLTTRLEYVPDSARSSVDANFSSEANAVGSLVLRWEIKAPVEPGAGGVLTFRCKVR